MLSEAVKDLPAIFHDAVRDLYTNGGFKGPCSALASAIWNRKAIETILDKLTGCSLLNARYTKNKFTPMALAAIQGNLPVMEALKNKGADLDARDILGYTALHHMAMMGNEVGVQTLLGWNASSSLRTKHGATYMDFLRFNAPYRKGAAPLDPTLYSAHTNDHTDFDPTCIPSDVKPADEIVGTPGMLIGIYAREAYTDEEKETLSSFLKKERDVNLISYDRFKKNPPKIAVKPVGDFCGLFAEQHIKKGEFIAEYTGQLTTDGAPKYGDGEYVWTDYPAIDAGPFRSPAAMANEGFPNVGVHILSGSENGLDGLPNRKLIYALEEIRPGEEIRINYGRKHKLKWDKNYQELGYKELQEYLQSHPWNKIYKSVYSFLTAQSTPGTSAHVDGASSKEKSHYILETPSVMRKLAKEKLIKQADLEKIRQLGELFDQLDPDGIEHRSKVLQLAIKALGKDEL